MKRIEGARISGLQSNQITRFYLRYDMIAMLADGSLHHVEAFFTADG